MDSDSVSWPAYDVRREALDELTPTEVFQAPQQHATRSGRAERCRTRPPKWRRAVRNNHACSRPGSDCMEKALDKELMRQEADLENQLQLNQTLQRVQQAAHRHLLFLEYTTAEYQAKCRQLELQNHYLQHAVFKLTLTMQGRAPGGGHMDGDDDEHSEASSADLVQLPCSEAT